MKGCAWCGGELPLDYNPTYHGKTLCSHQCRQLLKEKMLLEHFSEGGAVCVHPPSVWRPARSLKVGDTLRVEGAGAWRDALVVAVRDEAIIVQRPYASGVQEMPVAGIQLSVETTLLPLDDNRRYEVMR